ncbi:hypothetical protein KIH79_02135 [Bifidobacterium sp. 82T10]|uniref:Uncharacterized protein n=1 Tax=Bifidobacterium miconis TaxID=2834435 RepID=A0ABS6WCK3_9BIFI|nr:glycosyl hydrolase family 28 protein [Bifidobacterium miconis]MBW3091768.1 hypothetical protein [Bifidobacterium miconis]
MTTSNAGAIRVYPAPAGATLRTEYSVRVRPLAPGEVQTDDDATAEGWQSVPVYRVKIDSHYVQESSMCYFDFSGRVEVEVKVNGWFYTYRADVRPLSVGVEPHVQPDRVTFTLDHPANLSVELNRERHHNLHILAGRLLDDYDQADVTVEHALTIGPEINDQIERARAGKNGGDERVVVRIKPGYYYLFDGEWRLPSHVDVILEGGAVIEGSLIIDHAEDVRVRGRGVLYLADFKRFAGTNGVMVTFSKHVTLENLILINPPHYSVFMGKSRDVTIRCLKSFSCEGWSDGIDMMACEDVEIADCFLRTSDDCIAVYGSRWEYRGGSRNVHAHGCTLWADVAHPMMIGTHGDHEHDGDVIEHISFEDMDVLEHNEYQPNYLGVMAINAGDKNTVRDVLWKNVRIERISHGRVLDIETKWNKDYNPAPGRLIENVHVEDVDVTTGAVTAGDEEPSLVGGYDAEHPVRGIHIRNMRRDGVRCAALADANVQVLANAADVTIE